MKVHSNQKINFTAIPKAQYDVMLGAKKLKAKLSVIKLEKKDLPFFNSIIQKISQYQIPVTSVNDFETNVMLEQALLDAYAVLKSNISQKTKILIGVVDKEISGIIISNMPKQKNREKLVSSARKNAPVKEGELDWLVTWNSANNQKIKNQGQILIVSIFKEQQKAGFNINFIRAATQFNTNLETFYSFIGFKTNGKYKKWNSPDYHPNVIKGDYNTPEDDIITPMIITKKAMKKFIKSAQNKFNEQSLDETSIDIKKLINI